ncbi:uncharacterized protein DUF4249 [Lacibacter cauensis]|uniref:Uncharacterized protein DUF4249 n=1 Tax=Lacibacter cauensis TaxID=510947 RepID=A0A562SB67_9BACT|nr:DUF4249 family protein [Lacibacter cauensis]TWI77920.1 uncharacterized protein DUF4249 [Lacibacter cauensis]
MEKKYLIIAVSVLLFSMTGCEKVIDLELKHAAPVIVVDGQVTNDLTAGSVVKLSYTNKVKSDNSIVPLTGANVTIQEDNGAVYSLPEVSTGVYQNKGLVGSTNKTYNLRVVTTDGLTITSSSKMPVMVNFDSLVVEDFPSFGKVIKVVTPYFNDPVGTGNNYTFFMYKNGRLIKDAFAFDDVFIEGRKSTFPLIYSREADEFKKGDVIDVVMNCVDNANYKYWFSFSQSSTGRPFAVPDNPVSNIKGKAIGIFSAHTYQKRTVTVQ